MIAKADVRRVQEWMGHADIQTTMKYLHYAPRPEDARLVAERSRPSTRPIRSRGAKRDQAREGGDFQGLVQNVRRCRSHRSDGPCTRVESPVVTWPFGGADVFSTIIAWSVCLLLLAAGWTEVRRGLRGWPL